MAKPQAPRIVRSTIADGAPLVAAPERAVAPVEPANNVVPLALQPVRTYLRKLLSDARNARAARKALEDVHTLIAGFEDDAVVRFSLLTLRERAGERDDYASKWLALAGECPGDVAVARCCARSLVKAGRRDEALALIDEYVPDRDGAIWIQLSRAELLDDIAAYEQADVLFRQLIAHGESRDARVAFAKRLRKRGMLWDAAEVIAPVAAKLRPGGKAAQLAEDIAHDRAFFDALEPDADLRGHDVKIVALRHIIRRFRDRKVAAVSAGGKPSVALVTGNLGAGGAERQLSRLAMLMQASLGTDEAIVSRVDVLVKQVQPDVASDLRRLDFFLPELEAAGIAVHQINQFAPKSPAAQGHVDPVLLRLFDLLPTQVRYGITRLAPWLRENGPDVASLWQDGTCLFAAVAALLADTPVIHLIFRGLPPNIRHERFRPEYETLYLEMAEIPGVYLGTNSQAAAREYADWLNLALDRFHILYNCVPQVATHGAVDDISKWEAFTAATPNASETIGGVFRADSPKRPLTWIKMANRYLKSRPRARFVQVGDGPLLDKSQTLARELGIADRILFVGHSKHVGYWYDKMNVKVLMSSHEGLPNVLIEAQILGVPVVSTPAGGAGECFVNGRTGHLLGCANNPDLSDACAAIQHYVDLHLVGDEALIEGQTRARELFSISSAQRNFARLCSHGDAAIAPVGDAHAFASGDDSPTRDLAHA